MTKHKYYLNTKLIKESSLQQHNFVNPPIQKPLQRYIQMLPKWKDR